MNSAESKVLYSLALFGDNHWIIIRTNTLYLLDQCSPHKNNMTTAKQHAFITGVECQKHQIYQIQAGLL